MYFNTFIKILSYLEVTLCSIAMFVGGNNSDVFVSADRNDSSFRNKFEGNFSRSICCIYSSSGFIEVNCITILSIDQFYDIALWTTELRWGVVWYGYIDFANGNVSIKIKSDVTNNHIVEHLKRCFEMLRCNLQSSYSARIVNCCWFGKVYW